ncbi:MAG: hypothetical protein Tsb0027_20920 [Wenzhouxiangellaceae bacterium]
MSDPKHHEAADMALPRALPRALQSRLQALPQEITPARDLWPEIAASLAHSPEPIQSGHSSQWRHWPQALAAVLVLAVLAVLWQQLPGPLSMLSDPLVDVGTTGDPVPGNQSPANAQQRAAQNLLQGMQMETMASLETLPAAMADADLQAGLQEYELAEQQLQQALSRQPDNQNLWQQLGSLQRSRLNMFAVHIQ